MTSACVNSRTYLVFLIVMLVPPSYFSMVAASLRSDSVSVVAAVTAPTISLFIEEFINSLFFLTINLIILKKIMAEPIKDEQEE